MDGVKLDDDGKLTGWDDQLKALKESDSYLFKEVQNPTFKGFNPGGENKIPPDKGIDPSKMTYSEMLAYKAANPDAKLDY